MKNHVFLMQVHTQPSLTGRIVKKLEASNHYFIINVDAKCTCYQEFKDLLTGVRNVTFNKRVNVMHGGFSQVECTIQQMELALKNDVNFDYFHTISGQCYPCVSAREFDDFFENNDKSYMMLDTAEEVIEWRKKKYSDRLEHFYFYDIFNKPWMQKIHLKGIARVLFWNFPRKYPYMDELWGVELVFAAS